MPTRSRSTSCASSPTSAASSRPTSRRRIKATPPRPARKKSCSPIPASRPWRFFGWAHSRTGIDLHPGAEIGTHFFIDHGTGVVIGGTSKIGNRVRLYQGVGLVARSLAKNVERDGQGVAIGGRRHPTIGDDVTIYANATIVGGDTLIGDRAIVGGNVWVTRSIPPDSVVVFEAQQLSIHPRHNRNSDWVI